MGGLARGGGPDGRTERRAERGGGTGRRDDEALARRLREIVRSTVSLLGGESVRCDLFSCGPCVPPRIPLSHTPSRRPVYEHAPS